MLGAVALLGVALWSVGNNSCEVSRDRVVFHSRAFLSGILCSEGQKNTCMRKITRVGLLWQDVSGHCIGFNRELDVGECEWSKMAEICFSKLEHSELPQFVASFHCWPPVEHP